MIIENIQRPCWFRRIETLIGKVARRGSYGIMQVQADRPLSNKQSIKQGVGILLRLKQQSQTPEELFSRYNRSSYYAYNTALAYEWLADRRP